MEKVTRCTVNGAVSFAALLWLVPSLVFAQAHQVDCDSGQTIGQFLKILQPGATLFVSGTCRENVDIPGDLGGSGEVDRLILDGQGTAVIRGTDPTQPTVNIRAGGITIRRFEITCDSQGPPSCKEGIHLQTGTATIANNRIHHTGTAGIGVHGRSFAVIINNTIEDNPGNGIEVFEGSYARIGVRGNTDAGSPNTIQRNGRSGVIVAGSSSALIVDNTISNNVQDGVLVVSVSQAAISSNTIDANGRHGINVGENSGVNLGRDTGTTIFDLPNSTTVGSKNGTAGGDLDFGINCFINSYANGRLGTLNGLDGATNFPGSCVDSLIRD